MIVKRVLGLVAAASAFSAAAAVTVFALAFAFYAALEPFLGRAGAAGVEVLAFALLMAILGFVAASMVRIPRRKVDRESEAAGLVERLIEQVREKPFAAAGVAAALGLVAVAKPRTIGALLRGFLEGSQKPKKR